jgi:hypothetical protein
MSDAAQMVPLNMAVAGGPLDRLAALCDKLLGTFSHGLQLADDNHLDAALGLLQTVPALIDEAAAAADEAGMAAQDPPPEHPQAETISAGLDFVRHGALLNAAFVSRIQALVSQVGGEFGVASQFFDQSARQFENYASTVDDSVRWLADLNRAQSLYCDGIRLGRSADRAAAINRIEAAVTMIHSKLYPLEDYPPDVAGVVLLTEADINVSRLLFAVISEISRNRFGKALVHAQTVRDEINEMRGAAQAVSLTDGVRRLLSHRMDTMMILVDGLEAYAEAGQAAGRQQWDVVETKLQLATRTLNNARQASLEDKALVGLAAQVTTIMEMVIEPAENNWEQLRNVYEQLSEWKALYQKLAGKVGVLVDASSTTTVEQKVDVTVYNATFFNLRWQDSLAELRKSLGHLPPDSEERKALLALIDEQQKQAKEDPNWLDKAKTFTENAAALVGNVAKTVAPLASALNICAAICGIPPIIPV